MLSTFNDLLTYRTADAEADGLTMATEKDRLNVELEAYISNKDQVTSMTQLLTLPCITSLDPYLYVLLFRFWTTML